MRDHCVLLSQLLPIKGVRVKFLMLGVCFSFRAVWQKWFVAVIMCREVGHMVRLNLIGLCSDSVNKSDHTRKRFICVKKILFCVC